MNKLIQIALAPLILILSACAGERPQNLGNQGGRLMPCPDSPNCVSSFETDDSHFIEALAATLAEIEVILISLPEANIVNAGENYLLRRVYQSSHALRR